MQIGGFGVHLRLSGPADNDVAEQRHPASGTEQVVRSRPANRRVDPVPRRRGHQDIEASTAVVPLLEARRLDGDVAEGGGPLAGECGHVRTRLDGRHGTSEHRQRPRRLTGTAAHLQHRRPLVQAGDGDEVREQLVGVSRPDPVVELRHLVEHPTEIASIRACHHTILPGMSPTCRPWAWGSR
jgi:hypothetical protein